ncbi:MAG TPA: prolyl oligopeptidase family serine peptidase [Burkholderiaceae bacterium]|nr:prolyl oligopeptidase family serine peptidase [Burkholderiaceae bacterium]
MLGKVPTIDSASKVPAQQFQFGDGGRAIFFSLDKSISLEPAGKPETFVFVISGSGCTSMQYFLPRYFRGLEGESGPLRIFILQKRFIEERTWSRTSGCSREFVKADHPSRWISDQTEFIHAQLDLAQRNHASPQRIAIVGISEGGDIVPVLAQAIPGVTHAVIIANGGMNPLDAYRLQAEKHGFAAALSALDDPPADPDAPMRAIGGRTWRYWAELRTLRHTENLLALSIPIWMAMGDADRAVPVESALYLRDQFALHGKTNLTLKVYPGADHGLQAGNFIYLLNFWHELDLKMRK